MPDWYEHEAFWTTFRPILFHEARLSATGAEVDGLLRLAGIERPARVLDMGCGPGRHALELARRGHAVTAVDITRPYLEELEAAAGAEGVPVEAVEADMRKFVREGAFDLACSLFTSFGYFEDPEDDRRVLRNLRASLAAGGVLVVDLLGKEVVARGIVERWFEWLAPDRLLLEERRVTDDFSWMRSSWTLIGTGAPERFEMAHRLYAAAELRRELEDAGFSEVGIFGGLDGSAYDRGAMRLVGVGRR